MKFILLFSLLLITTSQAEIVRISQTPFSINCPSEWQIVSEKKQSFFNPLAQLDSEKGIIYFYRLSDSSPNEAIKAIDKTYRAIESQTKQSMPHWQGTTEIQTDSGIKGYEAIFYDHNSAVEGQFIFSAPDDSVYCARIQFTKFVRARLSKFSNQREWRTIFFSLQR